MQANTANFHKDLLHKLKSNKHLVMGYLFLCLVFLGAISSVYYWENKTAAIQSAREASVPRAVGSGAQDADGAMCAQVITRARNTVTGEVRDFPTPCDVVGYWEAY